LAAGGRIEILQRNSEQDMFGDSETWYREHPTDPIYRLVEKPDENVYRWERIPDSENVHWPETNNWTQ